MRQLHMRAIISGVPKRTRLVDKLVYIAAIVEPLMLYPQAYQLFRYQDASSIFTPTWVGVDILTAIWIWYAIVHNQKIIFVYQGLFFIANTLIIVGSLLYGGRWL